MVSEGPPQGIRVGGGPPPGSWREGRVAQPGGHLRPRGLWPCTPAPVLLPILQLRKPRRGQAEGLARVCAPPGGEARRSCSLTPGLTAVPGWEGSRGRGCVPKPRAVRQPRPHAHVRVFYDSATSDHWV